MEEQSCHSSSHFAVMSCSCDSYFDKEIDSEREIERTTTKKKRGWGRGEREIEEEGYKVVTEWGGVSRKSEKISRHVLKGAWQRGRRRRCDEWLFRGTKNNAYNLAGRQMIKLCKRVSQISPTQNIFIWLKIAANETYNAKNTINNNECITLNVKRVRVNDKQ